MVFIFKVALAALLLLLHCPDPELQVSAQHQESVAFQFLGPLAAASDEAYLLAELPIDQLLAKTGLHGLLLRGLESFGEHVKDEHPEALENAKELRLEFDELRFQVSLLIDVLSHKDSQQLKLFDLKLHRHIANIENLAKYINGSDLETLVKSYHLAAEDITNLNNDQHPFQHLLLNAKNDKDADALGDEEGDSSQSSQQGEQGGSSSSSDNQSDGKMLINLMQELPPVIPPLEESQTTTAEPETTTMESQTTTAEPETTTEAITSESETTTEIETTTITPDPPVTTPVNENDEPVTTEAADNDSTTESNMAGKAEQQIDNPLNSLNSSSNEDIDYAVDTINTLMKAFSLTNGSYLEDNSTKSNQMSISDAMAQNNPSFNLPSLEVGLRQCEIENFEISEKYLNTQDLVTKIEALVENLQVITTHENFTLDQKTCLRDFYESQIHEPVSGGRRKRQIDPLSMSVALASMAASGINSLQIHKLSEQLNGVEGLVDFVATQVEIHGKQLNLITTKIAKVYKIAKQLALDLYSANVKQQLLDYYEALKSSANSLSNYILQFQSGVEKLTLGRLSPFFTSVHALETAWQDLNKQANKQDLLLNSGDYRIVFQCPVEVFLKNSLPMAIIRVPLKSAKQDYGLFKYKPAPLVMNNLTFHLRTKEKYLAVDRHRTVYQVLTSQQFRSCNKINGKYSCDFLTIYSKQTHKSCLIKLFNNDYSNIFEFCDFVLDTDTDDEIITQIAINEFKIQTPAKAVTLSIACSNRTLNRDITIKSTEIIVLEPGCVANSKNYVVFSSKNIAVKEDIYMKHSSLEIADILNIQNLKKSDLKQLHDLVVNIKKEHPIQYIPVEKFKELYNQKRQQITTTLLTYRIELAIVVAIVLLAIIIPTYIFCKRLRRKIRFEPDEYELAKKEALIKKYKKGPAPSRPSSLSKGKSPSVANQLNTDYMYQP